jgi:hypothetical protein
MTYRSYRNAWIYYKFNNIFLKQKLKISYKFDFRLGLIDFEKIYFAINSKYGYLLIVVLRALYSNYSLKLLFKGHVAN